MDNTREIRELLDKQAIRELNLRYVFISEIP